MQVKNNIVVIGFSGGIDSMVSASLLKDEGYQVVGCTFLFTGQQRSQCFTDHVARAARAVDIPLRIVDLTGIFQHKVINYFKQGYLAGETPNPCTYCNIHIKWPELFAVAQQIGAAYVATGHYAQIQSLNGSLLIGKGSDATKEQSFFLWGLLPAQINQIKFPLGSMTKREVKMIAREKGFTGFASQKESTGPCFTGKNYRHTLKSMLKNNEIPGPGNFLSADNEVLGRHQGYPFYTISQRRGLGLEKQQRLYVKSINPKTNQVILGKAADLWCRVFYLRDYHIHAPGIAFEKLLKVIVRYRDQSARGMVFKDGQRLKVALTDPEWALTPGQTAALYYDDILVGGGFIDEVTL